MLISRISIKSDFYYFYIQITSLTVAFSMAFPPQIKQLCMYLLYYYVLRLYKGFNFHLLLIIPDWLPSFDKLEKKKIKCPSKNIIHQEKSKIYHKVICLLQSKKVFFFFLSSFLLAPL